MQSSSAPVRVKLLRQATALEPRRELSSLDLTELLPDGQPDTPVMRSRKRLIQIIQLLEAGLDSDASHGKLDDTLSELVMEAIAHASSAERNRALFLVAVLAADHDCAASMSRTSVAHHLCCILSKPQHEHRLSTTELQWVVVALAEIAASDAGSARLVDEGVLALMAAMWTAEGITNAGSQCASRGPSDSAAGAVGLSFAMTAVLANLAMHAEHADALLRVGILPLLANRVFEHRA